MSSAMEMSPATTRALRITGWSLAAGLLALPALAMQFTDDVNWTGGDFLFAAVIFGTVGGLLELAARASSNLAYRVAVAAAVVCGFLQIWINLAVGIIGNEDNSANWTYFAVVFMAAAGAIVALGDPRALMRAMLAAAGAQFLFSIIHALDGTPTPIIDGFFILVWVLAARLFARAAKERQFAEPVAQS
jgi:heme/copper-type cytochrome/quinol oxidase subunit 4